LGCFCHGGGPAADCFIPRRGRCAPLPRTLSPRSFARPENKTNNHNQYSDNTMKHTHLPKLALLSIALLSAGAMLSAQTTDSYKKLAFGITAGANQSKLDLKTGGNTFSSKALTGFQIGAYADIAFSENWSLVPELLYIQKGGKNEVLGNTLKFELSYLEVPVNVAYKLDLGGGSKLLFFGGAYLAYELDAKAKEGGVSVDYDEYTEDFDYGLNLGVGYQYKRLSVKLQYSMGLADISKYDGLKIKNKECVSLSVGFSF
jgi:opacity protein-like surface antigen